MTDRNYAAIKDATDRAHLAIREAADTLDYATANGGLTSPAELADCASDLLSDYTCYLTPSEFDEVYAYITREVFGGLGLDGAASDGTDVTDDMRLRLRDAMAAGR